MAILSRISFQMDFFIYGADRMSNSLWLYSLNFSSDKRDSSNGCFFASTSFRNPENRCLKTNGMEQPLDSSVA